MQRICADARTVLVDRDHQGPGLQVLSAAIEAEAGRPPLWELPGTWFTLGEPLPADDAPLVRAPRGGIAYIEKPPAS